MIVLVLLILATYATADHYDYDYYDYDYYDYYYDYYCYDYDYGLDYYLKYYDCLDVEFCVDKEMWVYADKETIIGNTSLVQVDREYYDIKTDSAIMECTPSLGIKEFADVVLSCLNDVTACEIKKFDKWDLIKICDFRRKGWLVENGTISTNLTTMYNELEGASDKIDEILNGKTKVQLSENQLKQEIKSNNRQLKSKSTKSFKKREGNVPTKNNMANRQRKQANNIFPKQMKATRKQSDKQSPSSPLLPTKEDKKKEKKEKKKYLKSLDMTKMPSKKAYDKLLEIYWILDTYLRQCVINVLELNL